MVSYLLRRRALGNTSTREVAKASTTGLQVYRNDGRKLNIEAGVYKKGRRNPPEGLPVSGVQYVFRYGCTSAIPDGKIVNSVEAIQRVNDKAMFRLATADAGLAPKSWTHRNDFESEQQYPVVVRSRQHAQGRNLHVCKNWNEVMSATNRYGGGNYYISELVNKVAEYRVFVCQGRVVWVAKKTPGNPDQVAWNVAQGGRFDNVQWSEWPLKAVKVSVEAFKLSGLHFGGVDVMVDAEGNAYVLEINSAPSQTSPYRQQATAKAFDYIVNHGRESIPLVEGLGNWKKFIHPCMSPEALMATPDADAPSSGEMYDYQFSAAA